MGIQKVSCGASNEELEELEDFTSSLIEGSFEYVSHHHYRVILEFGPPRADFLEEQIRGRDVDKIALSAEGGARLVAPQRLQKWVWDREGGDPAHFRISSSILPQEILDSQSSHLPHY